MSLEELAESLKIDVEVVEKLAATFVTASKKDLQELKQLLAAQDTEGVARVAHHIKGAAATLELEDIRGEAEALERQGRGGSLEGAALRLARLRGRLAALCKRLGRS
jgi:HPt (histidine-containing phosphotransfer) domain-containing protein